MRVAELVALGVLLTAAPLLSAAATETLCSADEEIIFSCETKRKTFEICASRNLIATAGYMQYRAGSNGKMQFVYPSQRVPPAGKFRFSLLARGAQLSFQNGEFTYEITEPLIGKTEIWVSQGSGGAVLSAECRNFTESLTLTTTQNRFKALGIYE
jgi:hypothetical protein